MFWTDWGRPTKIEAAWLDGSQRRTIVNTNLTFPNGLALDYERNLLYWVDAGDDSSIEYANFDGRYVCGQEFHHILAHCYVQSTILLDFHQEQDSCI